MSEEPSLPSPLAGEGGESSSRVRGDVTPPVELHPSPGGEAPPSPARGEGKSKTRRKFALLLVLALVAVGVWYFAVRTPEPKDDLGRFQGEWQLAVPAVGRDNQPAARARSTTVRVSGDRWVYVTNGKETAFAVTLRPEASPKEIDLAMLGPDGKPNGQVSRGVYEVGGGRARVVAESAPAPRPASLDDPDAGTVWLLERVK